MTIASSAEPFASATAWDVYSNSGGISATDNVVSVRDGATIVDAVALSNRDGAATSASMTAFADLQTNAAWTFGTMPVAGTNDCATQKDTASVATAATTCGGQPTANNGISLQRNGTSDTNQKKDFYAAAQTRGLANGVNPAPTVASALPSAATGMRVVFNEDIDAASVTGAFDIPGLGGTTATLSDVNEVTLVTASPQTAGQSYTLNIAPGVKDLQGTLGGAGAYGFCGFNASPIGIVINEVAPTITGSKDLVELRVTSGGAVSGVTLRANPTGGTSGGGTLLATLPNVCAATGDLFVVHLTPDATQTGETETTSKDQFATVPTYPGNYDGAWDVKGAGTSGSPVGVTATETVLSLYTVDPVGAPNAALLDAVAFTSQDAAACATLGTCTTSGGFKTALDLIEAAAQWTPACGGTGCGDSTATAPTAIDVSAVYSGVGTTPTGNTVARKNTDVNAASDWAVGAQSLGLANP
jgi:hypothetical protein